MATRHKQLNADQARLLGIFQHTLMHYPTGLLNEKFLSVRVGEWGMRLRIADVRDKHNGYEFMFFWPASRYARVTLLITSADMLSRDDRGSIPAFDRDDRDVLLKTEPIEAFIDAIFRAFSQQ